jgi:hypothetical protein
LISMETSSVKAYSKDPRLKGVDAVDRGMACQGMARQALE